MNTTETLDEIPPPTTTPAHGAVRIVELPKMSDSRGNLSVVEAGQHIPFEFQRVFYLYDVAGEADRGAHAHKQLQQFIIAVNGSFDVSVDNGASTESFHLDRPNCGLYVPPMHWASLTHFTQGAVVLVLASDHYDEADYYRDYAEFVAATR
jgi:dTDP-4-dehydrorhamnose 3,5-epimerase-like enzyme